MLKKILMGVFAVVVAFLLYAASRPGQFSYSRSAKINAPAAIVYAQIVDFHKWEAWSPWAKMDPDVKNTFSGPASGVGASHHWAGNDKVGEGRMTITDAKPSESIKIKLDFIKPFEANNTTEFTFKPIGADTNVVWVMSGENNFFSKIAGIFMDMDKMIGSDFERGLASLNVVAQAETKKALEAAAAASAPAAADTAIAK